MASSSRKKRARKGGEKKAGTGRNEKKKGTNNEKKLAAEVRDLEKHPAVAAVLRQFPDAEITSVRPLPGAEKDDTGTG